MKNFLLLFAAFFALSLTASANDPWKLKTNSGDTYAMKDVGFFVASDMSDLFSIVLNDSTVVEGVSSVTFVNTTVGIQTVNKSELGKVLCQQVENTLRVSGISSDATIDICNAAGITVLRTNGHDGEAQVNVSSLPTGTYILRVGTTAVKFIKK